MSWLNWSLKLHIRLWTISHLVPTHITHVYVQWMLYSFVWLYLFKYGVHTQSYVDQTQKYFWVFLVVFGKCSVLKIFRKTKNLCNSVFATRSQVKPATKIPCFAKIGLNQRQFSKNFQFSLASGAPTLSCPPLRLPKPPFSLTKPSFSLSIFH